ncbi:MAG: fibronectin type III domain-containing protein [Actinomycetota bacterium]
MTDAGPPPPPVDPSSPPVGAGPSSSTGLSDPTSEFLTPVHPYGTLDPDPDAPLSQARRPRAGLVALVVVVAVAAGVGIVVATSGGGAAVRSATPGDLHARSRMCVAPECEGVETSVALTWRTPDGDVDTIEILLDGSVVARVDPTATGYEVHDLWIDRTYLFGVRAIGADGVSPISLVEVRTPVPPLEEAQLEGSYRAWERVRRAVNLSTLEGLDRPHPGDVVRTTWSFASLCAADAGACPARWFSWGPLVNQGSRFEGSFRSRPASCADGRSTPTTTVMRLVTDRGRAVDGRWFVGRFHGTVTMSFTCPGGGGRSIGVLLVRGRAPA